MAVKIRLRAQGSVNRVMYRVVVADSRSPRDGKYIEALGWYNPLAKEDAQVFLKPDRMQYWIQQGAEVTEKVESLMKKATPGVFTEMRSKQAAKRVKTAQKRRKTANVAAKTASAPKAKAKGKA
jgi:small subunit ribosomal protein S16